jgi:23S rRNA pseudouridine955/2504/2580 synthase
MLPDLPAGLIYSSLRKGRIRVNGRKVKQSYRTITDDVIEVHESIFFEISQKNPQGMQSSKASEKLLKMTVLRTENLLLLNKPAGLLTHGDNSLAELMLSGLTGVEDSLSFSPAPLHRLDRNTSGLIAAGLTIRGAARFSELIRERRIKKYYIGLCSGNIDSNLVLKDRLIRRDKKSYTHDSQKPDGTDAVTRVFPLLVKNGYSLCLFRIDTGQTHQIRSQLSSAGFPLSGDNKYGGGNRDLRTYILHSHAMTLPEKDDICGFDSVRAKLPDFAVSKLKKILGEPEVSTALDNIRYL